MAPSKFVGCQYFHLSLRKENGTKLPAMREKPIDNKWIHRFLYKWQWAYQSSNTKGAYLGDDSVEMAETRQCHKAQRLANGVPWNLVLNYDQLWRSAFEPPKKVLQKRQANEAKRQGDAFPEIRPDDLLGKRLKAITAICKDDLQARMGQTQGASKLRKAVARSEFVVGGRQGLTAVTSTWASGEIGPLGICVTTGSVPAAFIREMNEKWRPHVYIFESQTETHFMTADTTMLYLQELIAPATC